MMMEFEYPEEISNYYKYRGAVESHNAKRYAPIGLETSWATEKWGNRVFAFLLVVIEVNLHLRSKYFYNSKEDSMLQYRKHLAEKLINNKYFISTALKEALSLQKSERKTISDDHEMLALPRKKRLLVPTRILLVLYDLFYKKIYNGQ